MIATVLTLTGIPQTAVDALVYGICGALGGAIVTAILGRHLLRGSIAGIRRLARAIEQAAQAHADAQRDLVAEQQRQTFQLAAIGEHLEAIRFQRERRRPAGTPQREEA